MLLASLSKDDGDGNEDGKKAIGFDKSLFTWRWGTPGRGGNPFRSGNSPLHIISHFNLIMFT